MTNNHLAQQQAIDFLLAHRGASGSAPENTLVAIKKAAELGAGWIEIDSNSSRDGQAVVFHDDKLERCSNGSGYLVTKTAAELQALDASSWFQTPYPTQHIPSLQQALALAHELGLGVNVEIKCTNGLEQAAARASATAINAYPKVPVLISSFAPEALKEAARLCPDRPRSYLCEAIPEDWQSRLASVNASALHCRWGELLDLDRLRAVQASGVPVRCYTLNQTAEMQHAKQLGISGVFSNYPERWRQSNA